MLLFTPQERRAVIFIGAAFFCGVCFDIAFKLHPPVAGALHALDQPLSSIMVNINQASYEELISVPGIGPSIAARIIYAREKKGRFVSLEELGEVKGFSKHLFARAAGHMTVGDP